MPYAIYSFWAHPRCPPGKDGANTPERSAGNPFPPPASVSRKTFIHFRLLFPRPRFLPPAVPTLPRLHPRVPPPSPPLWRRGCPRRPGRRRQQGLRPRTRRRHLQVRPVDAPAKGGHRWAPLFNGVAPWACLCVPRRLYRSPEPLPVSCDFFPLFPPQYSMRPTRPPVCTRTMLRDGPNPLPRVRWAHPQSG